MDPMTRKRRGTVPGESEEVNVSREAMYQAALSQSEVGGASGAGISGISASGIRAGEASPGTLESGGAMGIDSGSMLSRPHPTEAGSVLPTSNPFYSDRAKAEIELLHNRPATLDEEGLRLGVEVDEAALGDSVVNFSQEPNYGAFLDVPGPSGENHVWRGLKLLLGNRFCLCLKVGLLSQFRR